MGAFCALLRREEAEPLLFLEKDKEKEKEKRNGKEALALDGKSLDDKSEKKEPEKKEVDMAEDPHGALRFYAGQGNLDLLREAYRAGGRPTFPDQGESIIIEGTDDETTNHPISGNYALHTAVAGGSLACVKELLNWEADLEAKNRTGNTALHHAVSLGQVEVVKLLLSEGASYRAINKIGNTPLHVAAMTGEVEIAQLLLEAKASHHLLQDNKLGFSPLSYAVKSKNMAQMFYKWSQSKDAKAFTGFSPTFLGVTATNISLSPSSSSSSSSSSLHLATTSQLKPSSSSDSVNTRSHSHNMKTPVLNSSVSFVDGPTPVSDSGISSTSSLSPIPESTSPPPSFAETETRVETST